jgi:hypothetical protein
MPFWTDELWQCMHKISFVLPSIPIDDENIQRRSICHISFAMAMIDDDCVSELLMNADDQFVDVFAIVLTIVVVIFFVAFFFF